MCPVVNLTIDGQRVEVREGATILQAALSANIYIPTLCYHPLLKPFGACRLCLVEINSGGRSRLVTSCTYPAEEGLEVETHSPAVLEGRRMVIELLLARAPKARIVQRLAQEYGVGGTRFKVKDEGELCILCGLCARICDEIVGAGAINFVKRGVNREIVFHPEISPEICVGCGNCTAVCPTGCLELEGQYGIIGAIAAGRQAAQSIDKYLGGSGVIDETLADTEQPNPYLGREEGFADKLRVPAPCLPLEQKVASFSKVEATEEAKRCLRCELRLLLSKPILAPKEELWIEFTLENVSQVPEAEGVYQLLDEDKSIIYIKGVMDLRQGLEEQLEVQEKARYFMYKEEPMYTKRESELLQQYLAEHGEMPEGNRELEDLF